MSQISGRRLLGKALKMEGVEVVFAIWGGHLAPLLGAIRDEGIRVIDMRHEQAGAFAADAWARVTGQPGVVAGTAGPGVTNTVTAVVNAFQAGSPMIVIGPNVALDAEGKGGLEEMDHVALMRPITKWAGKVHRAERVPEYVSMAYRHALSGKPGPVYLDFPVDVGLARVDESAVFFPTPAGSRATSGVSANPDLVREAVRLFSTSQRPVVVAGSTVLWSRASQELQEFIETINAPLYLAAMGRGCLSSDHPLLFSQSRRFALSQADVVLLLGTPMDFRLGYGQPPLFNPEGKVIQVDIDQTEIGHNRPVDIPIMGDAKQVLRQLIDAIGGTVSAGTAWVDKVREHELQRRKAKEPLLNSDAVPINPHRLLKEIRDFLDRDAIVVGDGGDIVSYGAQVLKTNYPGHWMDPGNFGCLGIGTGFAIAAKLAKPDKQVLILSGDGSFGFNGMEFDTAVRHKIPIVAVIGNNQGWNGVPENEREAFCRKLGQVRYDKMVEALGGYGEHVEKPEDIRPALERAFASGLPACVNVMIDPRIGYEHVTSLDFGWFESPPA